MDAKENAPVVKLTPSWYEHCDRHLRGCRHRLVLITNAHLLRDRLREEAAYNRLDFRAREVFDAIRLTHKRRT